MGAGGDPIKSVYLAFGPRLDTVSLNYERTQLRALGWVRAGKAAATVDIIAKMVKIAPNNVIAARDRALICRCFFGVLRRSELVALNVEDLVRVPDGIRL